MRGQAHTLAALDCAHEALSSAAADLSLAAVFAGNAPHATDAAVLAHAVEREAEAVAAVIERLLGS